MLHWPAMRVGFITQLLWERYGGFWARLLEDAGAEVRKPDPERTLALLGDERVSGVPGRAFRLAVAQALALSDCDLVVAPSLNHGSVSQRGGGQDPWIADFPGAVATLGGLPPLLAVPAWLDPAQESLAFGAIQQLSNEPGRARRIWDRHRSGLHHEPLAEPSWGAQAAGGAGAGVLGQPWLVNDEVVNLLLPAASGVVAQHRVDPFRLRGEGSRVDPRLVPTDQEAVGAAHLFSRRGAIRELHLVVDESSGADLWLRDRIRRSTEKPLVTHELRDLLPDGEIAGVLLQR